MNYHIHQSIIEKLKHFHKNRKIPNIIFHGESGNGKRTIVNDFIDIIKNIVNPQKILEKKINIFLETCI